jgi:hypothetical protein
MARNLTLLLIAMLAGTATAQTKPAEPESMFPKGTWTMEFYGNYVHSVGKGDSVTSSVAAGGYYFDDRHVVRLEAVGYFLDTDSDSRDADDSLGGGLNIGLRYQFFERGPWTLFFEGIAGMLYGGHNFPSGGTHFNFNEQLGLGATLRLDEHAHLIGGARYMHISNARIHGEDENPTFDGLGGYIGVLFTY